MEPGSAGAARHTTAPRPGASSARAPRASAPKAAHLYAIAPATSGAAIDRVHVPAALSRLRCVAGPAARLSAMKTSRGVTFAEVCGPSPNCTSRFGTLARRSCRFARLRLRRLGAARRVSTDQRTDRRRRCGGSAGRSRRGRFLRARKRSRLPALPRRHRCTRRADRRRPRGSSGSRAPSAGP